jgi:hypothetical protein
MAMPPNACMWIHEETVRYIIVGDKVVDTWDSTVFFGRSTRQIRSFENTLLLVLRNIGSLDLMYGIRKSYLGFSSRLKT